jgi:multidrug efflux pump subunit AcrA (membrane-fusion protein)
VKTSSRPSRLPLPRRPLEWGLAIVAVALVAIAIASLGSGSSSSSAATKRTGTVGKGVVQSTVSGNGTLEPAQKVELSFGASGELTAIDVRSGEMVKKGQVLAEVDSSSARASLASAEAQLIEAEEAVESAEESEEEGETEGAAYTGGATMELVDLTSEATASATEGTVPVEGESTSTEADTAAELEAAKKEAAKLAKEKKELEKRAKEEAAKAKKAAQESASPAGGGSTTGGSTESAGAATESSGSSTTAAAGGEASAGGESTSSGASGGASVSLPTAEANLREAELSVKSARQEVRETTLRAPISGTIASISGAVGETVSGGSAGGGTSEASAGAATGGESTGSGSAFMVIAQLHRLRMEVSFSESDIGKVRKGQTATVAIDSMEGTELSGEVTKVSVLPSEGSTSVVEYPATILLSQSAKGLRAGMSASAEVVVEQVKNAITVPSEAISAIGGKTVTVEEDGKEVTKTITTGLEGDEATEVVSGLKAGETLVLPEVTVATASTAGGTERAEGVTTGAFPVGAGGFTGGPPSGGFSGGAP